LATIFGSIFGLSPVTSFIESGSGVEAGSRTGLTAVICGFSFYLSIFFAPIIASIPPWATGAATAFLTVVVMPLTYSIAYGLIAGIDCYVFIPEPTFEPAVEEDPIELLIQKEKGLAAEGPMEDPTTKTKKIDDDDMDNDVEATA
jgi:xanthine/uracil/vitamin C permease (AzgA family)